MRILVASDQWFPEFRGGSARVAVESAVRLARLGHDVDVIAPAARGLREGGVEIAARLRRGHLPQSLVDPLAVAASARRRRRGYDLAVAHQSTTAAGLLAGLRGVPLALVFHASASREAAFERARSSSPAERVAGALLRHPLGALERAAVNRATGVLALSAFSAGLVREDHGSSAAVHCVPGAVDTDAFTPGDGLAAARGRLGLAPKRPLLLTVRRLEPRMGIDQLLGAVAELDVDLVVGGCGRLDAELRALTLRLGISDRVRFLGRIPDAALVDWYRAADLFVLPTAAYEGFGLVTAESLACGTPVVGTPVGATPELLSPLDERLVAAGADAAALARAIEAALPLADSDFRARCRAYACRRLSWDGAIGAWERALLHVSAAGPRPSATGSWTFLRRRGGSVRLPSAP